ncbi:MAG TPA: PEP-CTERM sorting domain-containing protein [Steroidobacteraceae bacterium]|nr:PEP-CTERM sorting domain-containing protein [Steroidobacteraceae bacterium]
MSVKSLSRFAALGACLLGGFAMAAGPAQVQPGGTVTVPTYTSGGSTPTATVLAASCGFFAGGTCTTGTSTSALEATGLTLGEGTGGFLEAAGTTSLNPYGSGDLAFAFILAGSDSSTFTSKATNTVNIASFAGYSTSVQACGPLFGSSSFETCAAVSAGIAMRSSGKGNVVTFSGIPAISIVGLPATDGYVVYTNAPARALVDPNNFSVVINGTTYAFAGLGLTAPSGSGSGGSGGSGGKTGVPEPATLALLGLGLAGLRFSRRRRTS